jgi:hypothetical protein
LLPLFKIDRDNKVAAAKAKVEELRQYNQSLHERINFLKERYMSLLVA